MKGLLIFLSGVGVGVVGSVIYMKKSLIPDLIDQIREDMWKEQQALKSDKPADYDYEAEDEETEEVGKIILTDKAKKKKVNTVNTDYGKFSGGTASMPQPKEEPKKEEMTQTEIGGLDPYLIDEQSYDGYSSYKAHAFEVYLDGVVVDMETEEILDADPDLIFGKTAMTELMSSAEGVVYVRDDTKKCDYRLERRDCSFDGPDEVYRSGDPDDWRT